MEIMGGDGLSLTGIINDAVSLLADELQALRVRKDALPPGASLPPADRELLFNVLGALSRVEFSRCQVVMAALNRRGKNALPQSEVQKLVGAFVGPVKAAHATARGMTS